MANGKNREPRKVKKISGYSNKEHEMVLNIDWEDYAAWINGELIQRAMPYLTPDEREFLMTGITAEEWELMFKKGPGKEGPADA